MSGISGPCWAAQISSESEKNISRRPKVKYPQMAKKSSTYKQSIPMGEICHASQFICYSHLKDVNWVCLDSSFLFDPFLFSDDLLSSLRGPNGRFHTSLGVILTNLQARGNLNYWTQVQS